MCPVEIMYILYMYWASDVPSRGYYVEYIFLVLIIMSIYFYTQNSTNIFWVIVFLAIILYIVRVYFVYII